MIGWRVDEDVSVQYLLCDCLALQGDRLLCLGKRRLRDLEYLNDNPDWHFTRMNVFCVIGFCKKL